MAYFTKDRALQKVSSVSAVKWRKIFWNWEKVLLNWLTLFCFGGVFTLWNENLKNCSKHIERIISAFPGTSLCCRAEHKLKSLPELSTRKVSFACYKSSSKPLNSPEGFRGIPELLNRWRPLFMCCHLLALLAASLPKFCCKNFSLQVQSSHKTQTLLTFVFTTELRYLPHSLLFSFCNSFAACVRQTPELHSSWIFSSSLVCVWRRSFSGHLVSKLLQIYLFLGFNILKLFWKVTK